MDSEGREKGAFLLPFSTKRPGSNYTGTNNGYHLLHDIFDVKPTDSRAPCETYGAAQD